MKYLLINPETPLRIRKALEPFGTCISTSVCGLLPRPVSGHPDMTVAKIGDTYAVYEKNLAAVETLQKAGADYIKCATPPGNIYPYDIAYNCFTCGKYLFGNIKRLAPEIIGLSEKLGYEKVQLNQGYAKCSTVVLDNGIITADDGIYAVCASKGIKSLKISRGSIGINTYGEGFIGGAGGFVSEKQYAFFGSLSVHPDGTNIKSFLSSFGIETVCAGGMPLFDYGGIIYINGDNRI